MNTILLWVFVPRIFVHLFFHYARSCATNLGSVHLIHFAIPGVKHGLGVENLQGSGMIAGESSLAYDEIFTLSLVRNVVDVTALVCQKTPQICRVAYCCIRVLSCAMQVSYRLCKELCTLS